MTQRKSHPPDINLCRAELMRVPATETEMKDFTRTTRLTQTQRSAIRAGAQDFARKHGADIDVGDLDWSELVAKRADAKRAARDIIAQVVDGTPEPMAAAIEAAQDALLALVSLIQDEMDARDERGNRGPSSGIDYSRRPMGQIGSTSCGDAVEEGATPAFALRSGQPMRAWAQAKGEPSGLSAGRFLRALVTGPQTDAEHRALGGGSDAAGGFTVPTITSSELIDLARNEMVLAQAGARVVPLESSETVFAKLLTDPVAAFRAENSAVTESDPTFGATVLAPKSIAVLVKASVELMSDSINLERELPLILARALAVEIDRAGLIGTGTGNQPRGIVNYTGLTANSFAGGAFTSYTPLLQARGALHGVNERLTGFIMSARDENAFASLVASDGQPLQMPRALDGVQMLHTTSLPIDGGVGENQSQIIAGDFTQLMMGVRSEIRVEILRERFMDNLQFGMICHARIDFAATRDSAFTVLSGVTS
jgi:HK97 family phage major capsid protein